MALRLWCLMDLDEFVETHAVAERSAGTHMFMGIPDRWFDSPRWRCENGHVSTTILKSEGLGHDACLKCRARVRITFPEDVEVSGS